jgi:hypothetical protein
MQVIFYNSIHEIFRRGLQEEIPRMGFNAAACRKKSYTWDFPPWLAGRNPTHGI